MILLGNVGLQMLTPSREEWLDLPVTIRGGQRTHFVRLMCRAVQLRHEGDADAGEVRSSQTCSDPASAAVTPSTSAPGPDFEDLLSSMGGFQVFSRSLPRMKTISSVVAIDAIGQRARNTGRGRFNVPVTLLRTWFPDLQYGKGHRISAKIDGRFANAAKKSNFGFASTRMAVVCIRVCGLTLPPSNVMRSALQVFGATYSTSKRD